MSRDPMGERGGRNRYLSCRNNPVGVCDPYGMEPPGPKWGMAVGVPEPVTTDPVEVEPLVPKPVSGPNVTGAGIGAGLSLLGEMLGVLGSEKQLKFAIAQGKKKCKEMDGAQNLSSPNCPTCCVVSYWRYKFSTSDAYYYHEQSGNVVCKTCSDAEADQIAEDAKGITQLSQYWGLDQHLFHGYFTWPEQ